MPRKPIDRLKDHVKNHPSLVVTAQIKTTLNGVVYTLDKDGFWWMQPSPDSAWPTTPQRVTDPAHKRRIEATIGEKVE